MSARAAVRPSSSAAQRRARSAACSPRRRGWFPTASQSRTTRHGSPMRRSMTRVNRAAHALMRLGVRTASGSPSCRRTGRNILCSQLACAKLGAILACQNWRLSAPELQHCIDLVSPSLIVVSPRHARDCCRHRIGTLPRSSSVPNGSAPCAPRRITRRSRVSIRKMRCSSSTPAARPDCQRRPCSAIAPRLARIVRHAARPRHPRRRHQPVLAAALSHGRHRARAACTCSPVAA